MGAEIRQYVSFDLNGRLYGLDIRMVKEVHPVSWITAVPRSPRHVRGLINIRGQVVLVVDIAIVFGWAPRPVVEDSQIIILKTTQELQRVRASDDTLTVGRSSDRPVGLLADRIGDVVAVSSGAIEPTPPHLAEPNSRFIQGVTRLSDRLMVILAAADML